MNVVSFNGEGKYETSQDERNDVVHVRVGNTVSGSYPKEREEEQGTHGGHGKWHCGGDPPCENPSNDGKHVRAARGSIELHEEAYDKRQQRS